MLRHLVQHRRTLWLFAIRNVQDRYAGTLGGMLWGVLNPLLLLLVFWVVFGVGLRMQAASGMPFVLVLFCGLIPWMTFHEALTGAAASITGRAYLVKKIAFPVEVLPFTHVTASLFTHGVLLLILAAILAWHQVVPGAALIMLPYYLVAMCALAAGLSMLLAAGSVFLRDTQQGLAVLLNIWFWITPIVWPAEMVSPALKPLLEFNPLNYVVGGYKDSFLSTQLILPDPALTAYFWAVVLVLWVAGVAVFSRLKPLFADVI